MKKLFLFLLIIASTTIIKAQNLNYTTGEVQIILDNVANKVNKADSTTGAGQYASDHRADLIETSVITKLGKADSTTGVGKYATDHRADLIEATLVDTTTFLVEDITNNVIIAVSDTTVTAIVGRIVFKTSDKHFYGCRQTNSSYRKWFQMEGIFLSKATMPTSIGIACSDETTALTASTSVTKVTFRMPYAMTITSVRASVTTAPTNATILVDIHESGTTILSTKIMINATELTSTTGATGYVIADAALADDASITVFADQIGSTVAGSGLKIWIIGTRIAP